MVQNFVPTSNLTLVDDVLTLGRTSIAGASRLAEKFPNPSIRVFSLIQTKGIGPDLDIESLINIETGSITYNHQTGKCRHHPQ
jgi:hypothetical protein